MSTLELSRRGFCVLGLLGVAGCLGGGDDGDVNITIEDGEQADIERDLDDGDTVVVSIVTEAGPVTFLEIFDPDDDRVLTDSVEGEGVIEYVAEQAGTHVVRAMPAERASVQVTTE